MCSTYAYRVDFCNPHVVIFAQLNVIIIIIIINSKIVLQYVSVHNSTNAIKTYIRTYTIRCTHIFNLIGVHISTHLNKVNGTLLSKLIEKAFNPLILYLSREIKMKYIGMEK